MSDRLAVLAVQLQRCRRRGNRLTLECVLESARILEEARSLAGRGWIRWLREQGHMDPATARHHLSVRTLVTRNRGLTHEIATLSIAKIYKLSTLNSSIAVSLLSRRLKLSRPIQELSDVQFRKECRDRFGFRPGKPNRRHVFQSTYHLLLRTEKSLRHALHFAKKMTAPQRKRIYDRITAISTLVSGWRVVA